MDDKAIVPLAEHHIPISTGVRAHNKVLVPIDTPLSCTYHDYHIAGNLQKECVFIVLPLPYGGLN